MTAVLGDFLSQAAEHVATAVTSEDLRGDNAGDVVRELSRVITALARYLGDMALPDDADPARPSDTPWRVTQRTRIALRRSALNLRSASEAIGPEGTHPTARHLAVAADHLTAGWDLLQTRLALSLAAEPGQPESPAALAGYRYWAAIASSPPFTSALLAEVIGHARALAPWTARLAQALPDSRPQRALHDAARWLYAASGTEAAWQHHRSHPAATHALLHDIPVPLIPRRQPPVQAEPVAALCAGITATADRLRHACVTFAPQASSSPATGSVSWRRQALAAAISTQACQIALRTLTERATDLGADPALCHQLDDARAAAGNAWPAWHALTRRWDYITTGSSGELTPVAAEIGDLVVRTGRLARHNPLWTPAATDASPPRSASLLAPQLADITTVIAALHHASDALALIAAADLQAVEPAARADRLWMPTWLLPDGDQLPYRYISCPRSRITDLRNAYRAAILTSRKLTNALDDLAVQTAAPSQILTAPRRNAAPSANTRPRAWNQDLTILAIPDAGQVEQLLHDLHITEPAMLTRAQLADATALELITEATQASSRRHIVRDPTLRTWQHRTSSS